MSDVPYSYTKAPFEANLGTSSTSSSTVVKTSSSNVITDTPLPKIMTDQIMTDQMWPFSEIGYLV